MWARSATGRSSAIATDRSRLGRLFRPRSSGRLVQPGFRLEGARLAQRQNQLVELNLDRVFAKPRGRARQSPQANQESLPTGNAAISPR